jgi:phosphate transport system permease protein
MLVYIGLTILAAALGFMSGKRRAQALRASGSSLHSLPSYHGAFVALAVALPMVLAFLIWTPVGRTVIDERALAQLAGDLQPTDALSRDARLRDIDRIAAGDSPTSSSPAIRHRSSSRPHGPEPGRNWSFAGLLAVGLVLGGLGYLLSSRRISPDFAPATPSSGWSGTADRLLLRRRADHRRHRPVGAVRDHALLCQGAAERIPVRSAMEPADRALEPTRSAPPAPSARCRCSPAPCSSVLIAMLVAGPVGLFAAIYMAEYATPTFRAWVKPVLEVLAGILTVVFGFFAAPPSPLPCVRSA